jgi:hypothetical protein
MSYMSVDLEAKSTKERCIRVAAIAIINFIYVILFLVIQAGGWNICVEARCDYVRNQKSGDK